MRSVLEIVPEDTSSQCLSICYSSDSFEGNSIGYEKAYISGKLIKAYLIDFLVI